MARFELLMTYLPPSLLHFPGLLPNLADLFKAAGANSDGVQKF